VVDTLSRHPEASVPQATKTDTDSQGIYRFWANPQVSAEQIHQSHRDGVVHRARACQSVLAIQDTTEFSFANRPQTNGLGFINQSDNHGIKVHSCLAVSGAGEPLGLLHQQAWVRAQRSGKKGRRQQLPIEQKESYRWLTTLSAAEAEMPPSVPLVHIGDREADIFELFAQPRAPQSELLIRAEHNRKVQHELGYLLPTIEQAPVMGQTTLHLERNPQRPARTAQFSVKAMQVTLAVPTHKRSHGFEPVTLNAILVEETATPPGQTPIRWLLLTTLPIDTFEQLWQCVVWYSYRWRIERFHFTLKSGCRFEALQLQSRERLLKALATYNIVAWRLMWLHYQVRKQPGASCQTVFEPYEWKLLRRRFEPKNRSRKPPTLRQALRWTAQLGGFRARKGDGEPGLKTLWRGIMKFYALLEGVQLASERHAP
jgi:hypothetical protein